MPAWNDKMVGHQAEALTGLCKFSLFAQFTALKCTPVLLFKVLVLQHHSVHALDMNIFIVSVYFRLQYKWNQLSSNSHHTGCIHMGVACWEVTWPNDFQTRRSQYTGIPLDRLHWNHTGWCYHPVVFQWQSSVNLHNWNTLEDHWKTIGTTLETHWLSTILAPVAFQCTLGS